MKRQLPEGYTVKFAHYRNLKDWPSPMRLSKDIDCPPSHILPRGGLTECYLFDTDGNKVGEAMAVCGPNDNFNKNVGRSIALGRALAQLDGTAKARAERRSPTLTEAIHDLYRM